MVKEIELDFVLSKCSPKEFYDRMYVTDAGIKKFHIEVNKSENVDVSNWEDGRRVIEFTMPIALPDVLKSIVGTDKIPIVESQNVTIQESGEFDIESIPVPQIPGGSKFTTSTKFTIRATEPGGCKILVAVTCTAAGPWGLIGLIESVMAEQAKDGMKSYLEFCGKECDNEDVPNENLNPDEPKSSVSEDTNDFQDALSEASIADTNTLLPKESTYYNRSEAMLADKLQKLLSATESIQKELKDMATKLSKLQELQFRHSQKQFWTHFALGASCAILLWQQIRHR